MAIIKSLAVRERSNVDDMGIVVTAFITLLSLAWTFS